MLTHCTIAVAGFQLDQIANRVHAFYESSGAHAGVCDPTLKGIAAHDIEISPSLGACLVRL
jgi:hypothetical protein